MCRITKHDYILIEDIKPNKNHPDCVISGDFCVKIV